MKTTKSELLRLSIVDALVRKDKTINFLFLDGVEDELDVQNITIQFESYISKYPNCGLKIDYNTSELHKSDNVQKIAKYINDLNANNFEKFAALLIKLFDFELTYATKQSHDQGIDFIGIKKFKLFDSQRKNYLIGQAKKYNSLVNINEIRGFAGSVLLLRNREFSQTKDVYKSVFMRSFTSIEGLFATSYFFSPPAQKLCDNSDIISLDFVDLILLTEKAILEKTLSIETNDRFIKSKVDKELQNIEILH
ncbi:restriction endonuclease [Salinimicrobium gaetbulicola]|uniref:Restriction endonuclease n=1 Tax=Salinimicrobium gaetbulicola TaxID=999702 RepID=A0ABW3IHP5_9FLAO